MADKAGKNQKLDVGKQQVGAVYAKALLGAAEKAGRAADVLDEFESFVRDVLDHFPDFEATLASPRISPEAKTVILEKVFQGRMSVELLRFLKVVAVHGRLDCLRSICHAARHLCNEIQGRVEVQLTTATPITSEIETRISAGLRKLLGSEIDLQSKTDPAVIGGMVVRVGDTVYDASVANKLERLRASALEKSTQQMRQTLDRFLLAE